MVSLYNGIYVDKVKVMLVDDLTQIIEYFSMIIGKEKDMEIVCTARSGKESIAKALKYQPNIILMDIQMETDLAGIYAIEEIKKKLPDVNIIVLTIHDDDDILFKAYAAGAIDFLLKTDSIVDVLGSIRNVVENKLPMRPEIGKKILSEIVRLKNEQTSMLYVINIISKLTTSELEVLNLICNGEKYKQIAKERFVEEATIRSQVNKILKKTEQRSMKEFVRKLVELNVIDYIKKITN